MLEEVWSDFVGNWPSFIKALDYTDAKTINQNS